MYLVGHDTSLERHNISWSADLHIMWHTPFSCPKTFFVLPVNDMEMNINMDAFSKKEGTQSVKLRGTKVSAFALVCVAACWHQDEAAELITNKTLEGSNRFSSPSLCVQPQCCCALKSMLIPLAAKCTFSLQMNDRFDIWHEVELGVTLVKHKSLRC